MEYNFSEIMAKAWELKRLEGINFSNALCRTWANAKEAKEEHDREIQELCSMAWDEMFSSYRNLNVYI